MILAVLFIPPACAWVAEIVTCMRYVSELQDPVEYGRRVSDALQKMSQIRKFSDETVRCALELSFSGISPQDSVLFQGLEAKTYVLNRYLFNVPPELAVEARFRPYPPIELSTTDPMTESFPFALDQRGVLSYVGTLGFRRLTVEPYDAIGEFDNFRVWYGRRPITQYGEHYLDDYLKSSGHGWCIAGSLWQSRPEA